MSSSKASFSLCSDKQKDVISSKALDSGLFPGRMTMVLLPGIVCDRVQLHAMRKWKDRPSKSSSFFLADIPLLEHVCLSQGGCVSLALPYWGHSSGQWAPRGGWPAGHAGPSPADVAGCAAASPLPQLSGLQGLHLPSERCRLRDLRGSCRLQRLRKLCYTLQVEPPRFAKPSFSQLQDQTLSVGRSGGGRGIKYLRMSSLDKN